jgi:hypothetical protein
MANHERFYKISFLKNLIYFKIYYSIAPDKITEALLEYQERMFRFLAAQSKASLHYIQIHQAQEVRNTTPYL